MEVDDGHFDPVTHIRNEVSSMQEIQKKARQLYQELGETLESFDERMKGVTEVLPYLEAVNEPEEAAEELLTSTGEQGDLTKENISDVANLVLTTSEGPLDAENFKKFLMEKAWGKPKPPILPIIREYTTDIHGLLGQLRHVKREINGNHLLYMDKRRLDLNLNRRIDRLLSNIEKEMEKEAILNQHQTSITAFTKPVPPFN